jgi:hypothetical protein
MCALPTSATTTVARVRVRARVTRTQSVWRRDVRGDEVACAYESRSRERASRDEQRP